eukprot:1149920-Pelagomonas_calceolata.AAC.5
MQEQHRFQQTIGLKCGERHAQDINAQAGSPWESQKPMGVTENTETLGMLNLSTGLQQQHRHSRKHGDKLMESMSTLGRVGDQAEVLHSNKGLQERKQYGHKLTKTTTNLGRADNQAWGHDNSKGLQALEGAAVWGGELDDGVVLPVCFAKADDLQGKSVQAWTRGDSDVDFGMTVMQLQEQWYCDLLRDVDKG